jgi:hypothetical protein
LLAGRALVDDVQIWGGGDGAQATEWIVNDSLVLMPVTVYEEVFIDLHIISYSNFVQHE